MSDYNEHLISQAGGDGEPRHRIDTVNTTPRMHYCICGFAYGTQQELVGHIKVALSAEYGKRPAPTDDFPCCSFQGIQHKHVDTTFPEPPEPGHIRTQDWTYLELFPVQPDGFTRDECEECGATVVGRYQRKHVTWHNKLLP